MLTDGSPIMIRKVGNGFVVEPHPGYGASTVMMDADIRVFQSVGIANVLGEQKSLLEWIEDHFREKPNDRPNIY